MVKQKRNTNERGLLEKMSDATKNRGCSKDEFIEKQVWHRTTLCRRYFQCIAQKISQNHQFVSKKIMLCFIYMCILSMSNQQNDFVNIQHTTRIRKLSLNLQKQLQYDSKPFLNSFQNSYNVLITLHTALQIL